MGHFMPLSQAAPGQCRGHRAANYQQQRVPSGGMIATPADAACSLPKPASLEETIDNADIFHVMLTMAMDFAL